MDFQDVITIVNFGLGSIGSVLGVISTWRQMSNDKPRLSVRLVFGIDSNIAEFCGINVINTGSISLETSEVGFTLSNRRKIVILPREHPGFGTHKLLEPRRTVCFAVPDTTFYKNPELVEDVRRVFVKTACGLVFTCKADKKNLRSLIK